MDQYPVLTILDLRSHDVDDDDSADLSISSSDSDSSDGSIPDLDDRTNSDDDSDSDNESMPGLLTRHGADSDDESSNDESDEDSDSDDEPNLDSGEMLRCKVQDTSDAFSQLSIEYESVAEVSSTLHCISPESKLVSSSLSDSS